MCGIVGTVGFQTGANLSGKLLDTLNTCGPDSQRQVLDPPCWLGHQRLSIQDLSPMCSQPMTSHNNRYILCFSSEIYNHLELRDQLPKSDFSGISDTETLLEAISHWGIEATLLKLNGMFTFSVSCIKSIIHAFSNRAVLGIPWTLIITAISLALRQLLEFCVQATKNLKMLRRFD